MTSLALLLFSPPGSGAPGEILQAFGSRPNEVVVLQPGGTGSSAGEPAGRADPRVRVTHVLPIDDPDLLWPYGISLVRSDWFLHLNHDERPSSGLVERFPELDGCDAYVLARRERPIGAYTYHLRLLRTSAVRYSADEFGNPEVPGPVRTLERERHLVQLGSVPRTQPRAPDGVTGALESVERPLDSSYLRTASTIRFRGLVFGPFLGRTRHDTEPPDLGSFGLALALGGRAVGRLATTGSPALAVREFSSERARAARWTSSAPRDREVVRTIAQEVRRAGGLVRYLGFDRPEYVAGLSAEGGDSGAPLFLKERLVVARHELGRPVRSLSELTDR